jgi:hypothetical protein
VNGRIPQFEYPQKHNQQTGQVDKSGPENTFYVKRCKANDQQGTDNIEGHVQKVGRHFELFEKNLTEPNKQQPKKYLSKITKWTGLNTNRMWALTFSMSFSRY